MPHYEVIIRTKVLRLVSVIRLLFVSSSALALFQKPTDELGKQYVNFMRVSLDQIRQKVVDELYILTLFEVGLMCIRK